MSEDKMFKSGTKLAIHVPTNCVVLVPIEYASIVDDHTLATFSQYNNKYELSAGLKVDFRIVSAKNAPEVDDLDKI